MFLLRNKELEPQQKLMINPTLQQPTTTNDKPNTPKTNNKSNNSQLIKTTSKPKTHALEYNVIEYFNKNKENISLHDISTLP
jgi:hypothetical protein